MIERLHPDTLDIGGDRALPPNGPRIDDERVREILTSLGTILHEQIADANTFFMRGGGDDHRLAAPMEEVELAAWRSVFEIDQVVEDAIKNRKLFAVNIDDVQEALPSPSADNSLVRPYTSEPVSWSKGSEKSDDNVRVNYGDEAHWIPRDRITLVEDAADLTYLIKPSIHFGGYGFAEGHLYNAFVAIDTYVQAENGVQLVSVIPGTEVSIGHRRGPVYSPYRAIKTSLWTNTSIKEGEPNNLYVTHDMRESLMLGCDIHDVSGIDELEIPESEKLATWFWQIDRFIADQRLALPSAAQTGELST